MQSKILILSHPKLTQVLQQIVNGMRELPDVTIKDVSFGGVYSFLDSHLNSIKPNLIVTAGAHLKMLNQSAYKTEIPIIPIPVTKFDLLQATLQAQQYGKKIAVIYYDNELSGMENIVLGFESECQFYSYQSKEEAITIIKKLKENNVNAIIGTGLICSLAEQYNIQSIFLHSKDSILKILEYVARMETARLEIEKTARKWSTEFIDSPFLYPEDKNNPMITARTERSDTFPKNSEPTINEEILNLINTFLFDRPFSTTSLNKSILNSEDINYNSSNYTYITTGILQHEQSHHLILKLDHYLNTKMDIDILYSFRNNEYRILLFSKEKITNDFMLDLFRNLFTSNKSMTIAGFSNSELIDLIFSTYEKFNSTIYQAQIAQELVKRNIIKEAVFLLELSSPYYQFHQMVLEGNSPKFNMLEPLFGHKNSKKLLSTLRLLLDHDFSVTTVAHYQETSRQTIYKLIERLEKLLGILTPEKRFSLSYELRLLDVENIMKNLEPISTKPITKEKAVIIK